MQHIPIQFNLNYSNFTTDLDTDVGEEFMNVKSFNDYNLLRLLLIKFYNVEESKLKTYIFDEDKTLYDEFMSKTIINAPGFKSMRVPSVVPKNWTEEGIQEFWNKFEMGKDFSFEEKETSYECELEIPKLETIKKIVSLPVNGIILQARVKASTYFSSSCAILPSKAKENTTRYRSDINNNLLLALQKNINENINSIGHTGNVVLANPMDKILQLLTEKSKELLVKRAKVSVSNFTIISRWNALRLNGTIEFPEEGIIRTNLPFYELVTCPFHSEYLLHNLISNKFEKSYRDYLGNTFYLSKLTGTKLAEYINTHITDPIQNNFIELYSDTYKKFDGNFPNIIDYVSTSKLLEDIEKIIKGIDLKDTPEYKYLKGR